VEVVLVSICYGTVQLLTSVHALSFTKLEVEVWTDVRANGRTDGQIIWSSHDRNDDLKYVASIVVQF